jgi:D-alanine-D-alanine ligase
MRKLRVLLLLHEDLVPPETMDGCSDAEIAKWKTEFDVAATLRDLGHEVEIVGVVSDLALIRRAIERFRPHIAFNLLEEFHGEAVYDHAVVSYLELMRLPYTGCNARGLLIAHDKALSKQILTYHRVPVPRFAVFSMGRRVRPPRDIGYPLFVKSLTEDASLGISQNSIVTSDRGLQERVAYIHETVGTDAIAEQYIEGRELYVGVTGNHRLETFPIWEMIFSKLPPGVARIATERVKWDEKYQKRIGLRTHAARDIAPEVEASIIRTCRRTYHDLGLSGYARIDLRLADDGRAYVIEANPNPNLSYGEDLAESAEHMGIQYDELIQRILNLGLRYRAQWKT